MSHNYYNSNFSNNFTFQGNYGPPSKFDIPPPPIVPLLSDQEFLRTFESKLENRHIKSKQALVPISHVREQLHTIVKLVNNLKESESFLSENVSSFSDTEWKVKLDEINKNRAQLDGMMIQINDTYLEIIKNSLAKRAAKRLQQRRLREKRKQQKDDKLKEQQEMSRKIDENLQKIKDEIEKAQQEEASKVKSDIILREVTRKIQDAKKCICKLDALVKLRKARQNTARGRGMEVSENDAVVFNNNIEKLKSLWTKKLSQYEEEELRLRAKMQNSESSSVTNEIERKVLKNLESWKTFLFGANVNPQRDFKGNIQHFISARSQWDEFVSSEGTPLPVGWILPV